MSNPITAPSAVTPPVVACAPVACKAHAGDQLRSETVRFADLKLSTPCVMAEQQCGTICDLRDSARFMQRFGACAYARLLLRRVP
jgi:hypothetical protein